MDSLASLAELAHVHLLLNHFPTIGTVLGLGLLLLSFVRKNDDLTRVSLEVFSVIALVTLPAYMSGVAAQAAIKDLPGVSDASIATHQDAALLALVFMAITGASAWLGLWQFRRTSRPTRWNLSAVLLLSVVTVTLMARAANLGGEIRHPEILSGQAAAATDGTADVRTGWLTRASVALFVNDSPWVWPAAETLHFIGMSLLFGVLLVVNLRLLGIMKHVSFAAVHRLLPWGILGFGINFVTGMLFFVGVPDQYTNNGPFHWKMILLLLAGLNFLYLTVFDGTWALAPDDRPPLTDKVIAASALCLWVGVMYLGRMLPFAGNAF